MIKIHDLNNLEYNYRHGSFSGQAGDKHGVIYNNENWIIKFPKSTKEMRGVNELNYTTSPLSEYIGSQIYEILGYDVHKTILGCRNNKIVVACKDFLEGEERLCELRDIKNVANGELSEKFGINLDSTGSNHFVNFDDMMIHLEHNELLQLDGLKERFWDMLVIDSFINNNDRNNGNWGIIRGPNKKDRLAPIFDNGNSFYNKLPESKMEVRLENLDELKRGFSNVVTSYGKIVDGKVHMLNFEEILSFNNSEFNEAILRVVPKIEENIGKIYQMIKDIPRTYGNLVVASPIRKKYYIKALEIRLQNVLQPAYEKIIYNEKVLDSKKEQFTKEDKANAENNFNQNLSIKDTMKTMNAKAQERNASITEFQGKSIIHENVK